MTLWTVIPGPDGAFESDFLEHSHVAISYGYSKDLRMVTSRSELMSEHNNGFNQLWRFYEELETGALVAVPFTKSRIYIGEVTGAYEFRPNVEPYHIHPIRWLATDLRDAALDPDLLKSIRSGQAVHRVLAPDAEERVRRLAGSGIDEYLTAAQTYIESDLLDTEEMEYKHEIIGGLGRAREAVLGRESGWPTLIEEALTVQGSPLDWRSGRALQDWFKSEPEAALAAMRAFWANYEVSAGARIRMLIDRIPESEAFKKSQIGTTLRTVSALLMAFGPDYPPFTSTSFDGAYRTARYPRTRQSADQGEMYEHALGFLDRLIERAPTLGLDRPANRLEAQSVVWAMSQRSESGSELDGRDEPHLPDLDALAEELLLPVGFLQTIERLLNDKGQVIFQGPPGTGKTYVARKLAECLAGSAERVRLVQFHPSYAYEDFVQGYRPTVDAEGRASFELRSGPLVEMANLARGDSGRTYFLVIDEINRGNLAKVFGELYFLLEYRDEAIRLQYSDESFTLPTNLQIIGTMNTADRSIALVDLALRRRFHFVEFQPDKEPLKGLLKRWFDRYPSDLQWVAELVDRANDKLGDSEAAIGPSYFMRVGLTKQQVELIWEHNVLPYIGEQLYGERDRLSEFGLNSLRPPQTVGESPVDQAEDSGVSDADD